MLDILIIFFAFILTLAGVEIFRRWSLSRNILDIPNERSSHTNPTPRGAGLIIVLICLSLFFIYLLKEGREIPVSYFAGAIIVSTVSWLDDLFDLSAVVRFVCHSIAALIVLWEFRISARQAFQYDSNELFGWIVLIALYFWILWIINAYNFMDGIDGIAAIQAICAGIGWSIFSGINGAESVAFLALLIISSSFGFLILNWQPAKVFMGDVGSAFLGFTFGVIPLLAQNEKSVGSWIYFAAGIIFLWLFVFDTIITFGKRLIQKKKVWKAHREHIYQNLVISGFSHRAVSGMYGVVSISIIGLFFVWTLWAHKDTYYLLIILTLASLIVFFTFTQKLLLTKKSKN